MPGIAVVEDESIVALDIRNFLERSGYSVAGVYASGDDLLANCQVIEPDLVLMDIKIKGSLDGLETARIVYERHKVPVVLLTAYADDETVAKAKITHPFGYILKPFEERELRTAIEIALYRSSMEKKLRESEERYRRLFTEGISENFLADGKGRITEANPAFKRLMGIGGEEELPLLESLFPDMLSWESFREGLIGARRLELWELSLLGRGGREVHVLANAVALFDPQGAFTGIQGELTDTTERRKLEERLLQAQKMESIGRLAGGVAHDFNNILTAVLGYANLLTDEIGDSREARDDVEGIRNAAARAANLTRQLLAFSRRQPFTPKTFDLNTLIQDAERLLRRLLTEEVSLSLELKASSPWIVADPVQIEQILLNLAVNAKDSMPKGGDISIGTRNEILEAPKAVGPDTLAPGSYTLIEVRDGGEGIPPEIQDKIFEPFFTTKPKDRGTGLGLSMVYGIAKQSGGAVGFTCFEEGGTLFSVWLPQALEKPELIGVPQEPPEGADAAASTILFVDDDEALRSLASRLLVKRGHLVLAAANAGEALLIAESYGRPIDLLVTDTVMPFMDGYTLAKRLETILPGIGVLFVSGHPERAADPEASGRFLPKPFTENELSRAVSEALLRIGPRIEAESP